jgi:hypothetical protein
MRQPGAAILDTKRDFTLSIPGRTTAKTIAKTTAMSVGGNDP